MRNTVFTIISICATLLATATFAADPKVKIETSHGNIILQLDAKSAPETVANFVLYIEDGFYNGTVFHRVIKDFMIQGGGFTQGLHKKEPRSPIKNEANNGLKNVRGSIAMARTGDPHSATSQFFINTVDNSFLDYTAPDTRGWGYAVFGKVIQGMETVDNIRTVRTGTMKMYRDVPIEDVIITNVSLIEDKKPKEEE